MLPLFAMLPQANGMMEMGGLQFPMVAAGQQVQVLLAALKVMKLSASNQWTGAELLSNIYRVS